ncbi:MAG: LmeA family phospholipid-binding protein [Planctomycetales bacterium]|nr:LmeA family phospholipid-binding protein [bacterium]UNM06870.1 MAG: LmeA family phospholipid-binding protein [Planctomycetales bacterium]
MGCFQRLANFVLVLVVLALLALAALNWLLLPKVDEELADSVRREFLLPPSSTVVIGRGSLLDTLEGQVDSFYVDSAEAKLDGMLVEDLRFKGRGIRFDLPQVLLSGNAGLSEVQSGELELKVSEDALKQRWGGELEKKGMRDVEIALEDGSVTINGIFDMAFAEVRIGANGRIVADGSTRLKLEVDELQLGGAEIGVKELKAAFSTLTPVVDLDQFRVAIEVDKLEMHDGYVFVQARSRALDEVSTEAAGDSELDKREQELLDELERVRRKKEQQEALEKEGAAQQSGNPAPDYIPDESEPDEKDMNSLGGEA